jgi:hypothetical protein
MGSSGGSGFAPPSTFSSGSVFQLLRWRATVFSAWPARFATGAIGPRPGLLVVHRLWRPRRRHRPYLDRSPARQGDPATTARAVPPRDLRVDRSVSRCPYRPGSPRGHAGASVRSRPRRALAVPWCFLVSVVRGPSTAECFGGPEFLVSRLAGQPRGPPVQDLPVPARPAPARCAGRYGGRQPIDLCSERHRLISEVGAEESAHRQQHRHWTVTEHAIGQSVGIAAVHPRGLGLTPWADRLRCT